MSLKFETNDGKRGVAVSMAGRCITSGLSEEEAERLVASLLNALFAEPKSH